MPSYCLVADKSDKKDGESQKVCACGIHWVVAGMVVVVAEVVDKSRYIITSCVRCSRLRSISRAPGQGRCTARYLLPGGGRTGQAGRRLRGGWWREE